MVMAKNGATSFRVLILKENIYDKRCIKMKDLIEAHYIWEVVEKCYKESQDEDSLIQTQKNVSKDSRKRDKKIFSRH